MHEPVQVTLPGDLVKALELKAKAMGLDLPAYFHFLKNVAERQHDQSFADAAKFTFSRYPKALRKLAV